MSTNNKLEQQIQEGRRTIASDGYPMSIGELTNLYKESELIIRPEFQRFYRWSHIQKSRLVESLLLGIPLPSIFVAQTENGKWELIDGLQRVSTILELQGELLDEHGKKLPALVLSGTKYLNELEGKSWISSDPNSSFSDAIKLDVKRSKIDVKIIKRESTSRTKFDLFQRLNSYGSTLTAQEIRSAMLVAVSPDFYAWLEALSKHKGFVTCVSLSDTLIEERFDLELVVRFLLLHNRPLERLTQNSLRGFTQILDDEAVELASNHSKATLDELERTFKETFDFISLNGGENAFRRWDYTRGNYRGSFLTTSFEVFALGLGFNIRNKTPFKDDLEGVIKEFWSRPEMQEGFATGRSTEKRLSVFVPLGREILKK
ncbi:TPA: DUF262 domain-containing protein [Aeromonas hydrophila]|uniref:GmrSD restriction endonuclease domain-containing protein n=1 Tax=Aeromonas TaxID=642 RepID=UPI0009B9E679|nr:MULTISPECIES: DUF262 domain-containing protein [Aeromonas]MCK2072933.1 DUF262 domain-containing protein [Aeromonas caviae]HAU4885308.1 DUF262 domain-containing protein [Aeromonas hydrophila]